MSRVEVWRGSLGRGLFSPVGPPFRLRVSHHFDRAPSPHPAHRTGQADLPHPALGQGDSHVRSRRVGCRALELEQPQGSVQVAVREA
jgi:transposase